MQTCPCDENSVCLSVCLTNAYFVTKRKKNLSIFLYCTKDHFTQFSEKKMYLKFLGKADRVGEIADF